MIEKYKCGNRTASSSSLHLKWRKRVMNRACPVIAVVLCFAIFCTACEEPEGPESASGAIPGACDFGPGEVKEIFNQSHQELIEKFGDEDCYSRYPPGSPQNDDWVCYFCPTGEVVVFDSCCGYASSQMQYRLYMQFTDGEAERLFFYDTGLPFSIDSMKEFGFPVRWPDEFFFQRGPYVHQDIIDFHRMEWGNLGGFSRVAIFSTPEFDRIRLLSISKMGTPVKEFEPEIFSDCEGVYSHRCRSSLETHEMYSGGKCLP